MIDPLTTGLTASGPSRQRRPRGLKCSTPTSDGQTCQGRALRTGHYTVAAGCQWHASGEEKATRKAWLRRKAMRRGMRASA